MNKLSLFELFINDILPSFIMLSLNIDKYALVISNKNNYNLDFDDAYQFALAKSNNIFLVTLDSDFKKVEQESIKFL